MRALRLVAMLALLAVVGVGVVHAGDAPAPAAPPAAAPAPGTAASTEPEQPSMRDDRDVLDASEKWLKLIDNAQYGAAWDAGAKPLKDAVTRPMWNKGIADARKPFGKVAERKRERFARAHELPGAPPGDYAIVEFITSFTNGKRAVEQLVWTLDDASEGGIWRVSGYYIR